MCQRLAVRVLVVEDDDTIGAPLAEGLRREGFEVDRVATGAAALARLDTDLVLLDLNLPDVSGFEICRTIRAHSDVPIICLTARAEEADRVAGLELGADDYVVKPFGFRELVARINAVSRRRATPGDSVLTVGRLSIDRRSRQVRMGDSSIELTPKEYAILVVLSADPGAVVERETLLEEAWGQAWYGPTKTLDVHVAALRRKLGDHRWIEAVRGVGFRLADPA